MPRQDRWTTSLIILACSIAGMTWAAAQSLHALSITAAAIATLALSVLAYELYANAHAQQPPVDLRQAARSNAMLMALAYGWGGAAMLAVYMLTHLHWRHGWQYGSGMLLIALGLYVLARKLADPSSASPRQMETSAYLALSQGIAASIALVILAASGKLQTAKDDWAANHIFVAGGLAIVVISFLAFATHRRLSR